METPSTQKSFLQKHYRPLIPLAAAVVIGIVAIIIAIKPESPKTPAVSAAAISPSQQVLKLSLELYRRNQPDTAVEVLQNYLAKNRMDQEVRLRLVELYMILGKLDLAEETLIEAQTITPENADVLWKQGVLAMQRGFNPEELFRKAAQTPNASAEVLGNFGLYLLSEEQPEEAETYLKRAVDGNTANGHVYEKLGTIVFLRKNIDEAYRLLKRATELSPHNVDAWAMLAEVQKNRNESVQAMESLQKALAVAVGAQRGMVLMELGKAQMADSHWSQAAELFAQAADYPVARARAAFWAAQCYYHTETYSKAMHYIDQAMAVAPDNPQIRQWKQKIEYARYGPPANAQPSTPSLLDIQPKVKPSQKASENTVMVDE